MIGIVEPSVQNIAGTMRNARFPGASLLLFLLDMLMGFNCESRRPTYDLPYSLLVRFRAEEHSHGIVGAEPAVANVLGKTLFDRRIPEPDGHSLSLFLPDLLQVASLQRIKLRFAQLVLNDEAAHARNAELQIGGVIAQVTKL
jgi:hypothetical protein